MTKSLREYLNKLYEEWDLFSIPRGKAPREGINPAIQIDISILVEHLEKAHEEIGRARNVGYTEGWEAARKFYVEGTGA